MTGILLSLKGGVMKPIRNWPFAACKGAGGGAVEGVTGVDAGRRDPSKRVARFRTFTSSGKSADD